VLLAFVFLVGRGGEKTHVCDRGDDGTQNAHDAVPADSDAVSGSAVCAGQHFWGVRVERALLLVSA
jgi:hypothetical protein